MQQFFLQKYRILRYPLSKQVIGRLQKITRLFIKKSKKELIKKLDSDTILEILILIHNNRFLMNKILT